MPVSQAEWSAPISMCVLVTRGDESITRLMLDKFIRLAAQDSLWYSHAVSSRVDMIPAISHLVRKAFFLQYFRSLFLSNAEPHHSIHCCALVRLIV